ncbi:hypothetical protein [Streptomyces taklimakanensis]|uniref:hypothetical protein n=1 Tax=Streptomyces taklimakanensis TaxID=2569853 RepID=UPI001391F9D5|nr:hypothetical protein [Streptomyces taklimakanensis]
MNHPPAKPRLTPEQTELAATSLAEAADTLRRFFEALLPVTRAAAESMSAICRCLQDTDLTPHAGRPTRPGDRPAWQSPYGPPQRLR